MGGLYVAKVARWLRRSWLSRIRGVNVSHVVRPSLTVYRSWRNGNRPEWWRSAVTRGVLLVLSETRRVTVHIMSLWQIVNERHRSSGCSTYTLLPYGPLGA